jgi:glutamate formiminotransferase
VNVLDHSVTPVRVVFERIVEEATRRGVAVLASELVGLAPTAVLAEATRHVLRVPNLSAESTIETRLLEMALAKAAG